MDRDHARAPTDERAWEQRLFPMLVAAFSVASAATLASAAAFRAPAPPLPPPAVTTHAPSRPSVAARGDHLVAVQVADVVVTDGASASVVLLEDGDKQWVLPLFVKQAQAEELRLGLRQGPTGRSGAATLLAQTVEMLGATVVRVEVDDVSGEDCLSQVVVRQGSVEVAIDARPEDAVAVALATGSPVFAASRVLTSRGIRREDVVHGVGGLPTNARHPERL